MFLFASLPHSSTEWFDIRIFFFQKNTLVVESSRLCLFPSSFSKRMLCLFTWKEFFCDYLFFFSAFNNDFLVCLQVNVFAKRWREVLKWGVNAQGFSQALRLNTLRTLRSWGVCFLSNLLRPTRGHHREKSSIFSLHCFIFCFPIVPRNLEICMLFVCICCF